MVCWGRPYQFKFFIGNLPQILISPFLNTLAKVFKNGLIGKFCTLKIRALDRKGLRRAFCTHLLVQIARMRKSRPNSMFCKIRENTESNRLLMFWKKLPMNNISNSVAIQSCLCALYKRKSSRCFLLGTLRIFQNSFCSLKQLPL